MTNTNSSDKEYESDVFSASVVIALGRIYDLLLLQIEAFDPEKAAKIVAMHKEGKLLFPPPAIDFDDEQ